MAAHTVGLAPLCTAGAAPADLIESHKDEAPGVMAEGFKEQGIANTTDCAQVDADRKHFAKLAAHAAMAGCTLHELSGGGFLLCRWGLAKELHDMRAVAALLGRMGVRL